ncbi:hypothetical protein ABB37_08914 [Leptomonas pyrrhocoris]|uniref:Uncharacterized protein n=1 Tax=Leptomonas pyrrhocoris TaxID=157538 RepID=A0A0M9FS82_LEPPY|nr:hypothetical protein ABB37_08914 [Leptomonas pyrrhocoris]KPA74927.1 hypothetical protein ABB37_08914 [Leptomonas pyrrhocoris]|eukprot:XP_015653366.1 hypothetical protein ABB37_08914 [Leptomonas pyrrhocoris]
MRRARQNWAVQRTPCRIVFVNVLLASARCLLIQPSRRAATPSSARLAAVTSSLVNERRGASSPLPHTCTQHEQTHSIKNTHKSHHRVNEEDSSAEQPFRTRREAAAATSSSFRGERSRRRPVRVHRCTRGGVRDGRVGRDGTATTAAAASTSTAFPANRNHGNPSSSNNAPTPPAAAAAFHAFLRQQNCPYVRSSADEAGGEEPNAPSLPHRSLLQSSEAGSEVERLSSCGRRESSGASREAPAPPRAGARRRWSSNASALDAAPDSGSPHEKYHEDDDAMRTWCLRPATVRPTTAVSQARAPLPTSSSRTAQQEQHRRDGPQDAPRQRRHELVRQAGLAIAKQMSGRHRHEYRRTALQSYQLLKKMEGDLFYWSQQRRQQRRGRNYDAPPAAAAAAAAAPSLRAAIHGGDGKDETNVDAVEGRLFEYAGQVQRTLHQLTPRHFDAMRGYRLHRPSSASLSSHPKQGAPRLISEKGKEVDEDAASAAARPPLFLLRLLWRLLHITRLFYSIGRHASLPRSAVHSYVLSANCAYGMREVLRVLGEELALAPLTLAALSSSSSSMPSSAASAVSFSREELFQVFYAALCISSEEVPNVPVAAPAAFTSSDHRTDFLLRFQRDCAGAAAVAARMPVDEWCVRWWCHVYAPHHAASAPERDATNNDNNQKSTSSLTTENGMDDLLTLGQAMDVIRASLYATTSVEVTTASSSSSSASTTSSPWAYFETFPRGGAESPSSRRGTQQRELERRYRPRLIGALGGDRTLLRIPYHLGQRFVAVFLRHILSSSAATRTTSPASSSSTSSADPSQSVSSKEGKAEGRYEKVSGFEEVTSASSSSSSSAFVHDATSVEAALGRLLHRHDRDAVRDVALLCTAILYFEVFSADTAAFMAHAAPLCQAQVELLSGHEISCVLLAYASLQRWEGRASKNGGGAPAAAAGTPSTSGAGRVYREGRTRPRGSGGRCSSSSSGHGRTTMANNNPSSGDQDTGTTVHVQSASSALNAGQPSRAATPSSCVSSADVRRGEMRSAEVDGRRPATRSESRRPAGWDGVDSSAASSSSKRTTPPPLSPAAASSSWHAFFVTLGSRAGQLGDTLSEADVTRVLRALELVGLEHEDLRRALESSLRMRNLGRRVLYET